jgi:hypothetical protein
VSLQLILTHYLASLRERNELDALLPELLKSMGHSVHSRAQTGVQQAGVDLLSTQVDAEGVEEVFLWILKFGDLGRGDLHSGQQSVEPSVREAVNEYVRNRLPANLVGKPVRVVVVSNGVLKQEAQSGFAALTKDVAEKGHRLEFWGMDQLTPLIEAHLFGEALLLSHGKSDLRAALAGIEESETAVHRFARFLNTCFNSPAPEREKPPATRKRLFLKRCGAATMGYGVLTVWSAAENNLKPAVIAGDCVLLRLWAEAINANLSNDEDFLERMIATMQLHLETVNSYYEKIMPTLLLPRALVGYRPNPVVYAQLVFEELGRLATLLLIAQFTGAPTALRGGIHRALKRLVGAHTVCCRPVFDDHSIDLSLAVCALLGEDDLPSTKNMLRNAIAMLKIALRQNAYLPVDTDLLEDAMAAHVMGAAQPREFFQTSTLVPMLATVAAAIGDDEALGQLRALAPHLDGVTLERWYPSKELETFAGAKRNLGDVSVSRALAEIRATAPIEVEASLSIPEGASKRDDFVWCGSPLEVLVALSARLHRHPLPTWFILHCASGALRDVPLTGDAQPAMGDDSDKDASTDIRK